MIEFLYRRAGDISGLFISCAVLLGVWFFFDPPSGILYFVMGLCMIPALLITDSLVMREREFLINRQIEEHLEENMKKYAKSIYEVE